MEYDAGVALPEKNGGILQGFYRIALVLPVQSA
jgi:hypothetical protein